MAEVNAVPLRRRNGLLPSCEPCRKSKYSCDHTKPICGRCIKRGISGKCTYHPAPMRGATPRTRRSTEKRSSSAETWVSQPSDTTHLEHEQSASFPQIPAPTGFLGSTSYNAVFTEGQNEMGIDEEAGTLATDELGYIPPASSQEYERKLKQAQAMLSVLRHFKHFKKLLTRWTSHQCDMVLISPWFPICMASVEQDLVNKIDFNSNQSLMEACEMLFRNTSKPIVVSKDARFQSYARMFTGENLRWEAVGMIFTFCGLCCNDILPEDPILDFVHSSQNNRSVLAHKCLNASNLCVDFYEETRNHNDIGLWLTYENCILMSQTLGDDNYLVWRRVGDLSTAVFASGLHLEDKNNTNTPFWQIEVQRRAFAAIYNIDKVLCTFVGRPPRINQRYCSASAPLDIEFAELALEGEDLQRVLSTIDSNGWNTDGKLRRSTCTRTSFLIARLREEVLEISLGPVQSDALIKARDILLRNSEVRANLPEQMQYSSDIWNHRSTDDCFMALTQNLDILYNEFMLQRTLVRHYRQPPDALLQVAQSLMTAVLEGSRAQGAFRHLSGCLPWLIALHGLPAAGVLALELLQQSKTYFNTSKAFARSKVIQDLSVFVSCLSWIHRPGDGNYQLIQQARKMIQKILDKVLSPEPPAHIERHPLPSPEEPHHVIYQDPMYDFSWIENAEFDADFWMSLPEHPLLSTHESQ